MSLFVIVFHPTAIQILKTNEKESWVRLIVLRNKLTVIYIDLNRYKHAHI